MNSSAFFCEGTSFVAFSMKLRDGNRPRSSLLQISHETPIKCRRTPGVAVKSPFTMERPFKKTAEMRRFSVEESSAKGFPLCSHPSKKKAI